MRSSTSSFDRAPATRGLALLCIAALTAVTMLAGVEAFWRLRGVEPGYVDNPRRWSYFREKVDTLNDPRATVLIGASRMQLDWSLEEFRTILPGTEIIQLAIDGIHPWAVLQDLAQNTTFAGVVLVALTAPALLPDNRDDAAGYVSYFEDSWTLDKEVNFRIDDFLQKYLTTRQPYYGLGQSLRFLVQTGNLPRGANYLETTRERERNADYGRLNITKHRAERIRRVTAAEARFRPPAPEVWARSVNDLDDLVRPMVQRGAKVIFIRFPTADEHWDIDARMYPRDLYWDYMASHVSGLWLHFKDVEGLDRFILPDTSHLDRRDKAAFTRILVGTLRDLGVY